MFVINGRRLRQLGLGAIYTLGVLGILASGGGGGGGSSNTPDTKPPTVAPGAQANAPRNRVVAIFNEPMDGATINTNTFTLEDFAGTPVSGSVTYGGVTATFTPDVQLASSATYTATITAGVRDASGNPIASDVSWQITTASGNIRLSWDANLETAVQRAGGGYKVYYSAVSGFNPGDGGVTEIDVPYVSGALAPTSIVAPFDPGIYYLRIAAYSLLNPPGAAGGSTSTASPQITLDAP